MTTESHLAAHRVRLARETASRCSWHSRQGDRCSRPVWADWAGWCARHADQFDRLVGERRRSTPEQAPPSAAPMADDLALFGRVLPDPPDPF